MNTSKNHPNGVRFPRAVTRLLGAIALTATIHCAQAQQPASGAAETQLPPNAGANLALNKAPVCSDPNAYNWDRGLTNGSWEEDNANTFATGAAPTFPKTVTIDLDKPENIGLVLLGVPKFGCTKTVTVSVSADGTAFKDVGSYEFSQNKTEKHLFTFPATAARYVRLTYPDHYEVPAGSYPVPCMFTTELEVYAPAK